MGEWDELCVLSGICPGGGPHDLLHVSDVEQVSNSMASEIQSLPSTDDHYAPTASRLTTSDLKLIVNDALTIAVTDDSIPAWFSGNIHSWHGSRNCVAIGHFDIDGTCPREYTTTAADDFYFEDGHRIPLGDDVEVRTVLSDAHGSFGCVVLPQSGGEKRESKKSECSVRRSEGLGNVFVLEGCWIYLQAWLNHSLSSPRLSFRTGKPLSLASEFYEIVNSREELRRSAGYLLSYLTAVLNDA